MPGAPSGFGMPAWCGGRGQGPEDLGGGEGTGWDGIAAVRGACCGQQGVWVLEASGRMIV